MTRRAFMKQSGGLALAGSATLLSNSALAQSDTVRWRCASSFPKSVDTLYGTAELIARRAVLHRGLVVSCNLRMINL